MGNAAQGYMAVTGAVDMASRPWRSGTGDKAGLRPLTEQAVSGCGRRQSALGQKRSSRRERLQSTGKGTG